jgi:hypothetical protein
MEKKETNKGNIVKSFQKRNKILQRKETKHRI